MIHRRALSNLIEILDHFPVLGIIGSRQCGKTTIARQLMEAVPGIRYLYLYLENPEDLAKLTDPVLYFRMNQEYCVVLDEIQQRPDLFSVLRSMIDQQRTAARFIVLGSASPALMKNSSQSLAGRVAHQEISPLNYTEIHHLSDYSPHWLHGGYPDAYLGKYDKIKGLWLTNFIRTYIERDVPALDPGINTGSMRQLISMLAQVHGQVINYSNLSRSMGVTSPTVIRYIGFLENSFLIRQLQPYFSNSGKRLVKSPKLFIRDSGILHSLLSLKTMEEVFSHPQLGSSWEGYVTEQILQLLPDGFAWCYYRTHEGAECDLVILKGGKPFISIEKNSRRHQN